MKKLYKETEMCMVYLENKLLHEENEKYEIIQIEVINDKMAIVEYIKKINDKLTVIDYLGTNVAPIETLHSDHQPKKMTKAELVQYLYDNYYDVDDNTINLSNLDFSKLNCNVIISGMEVNGNLGQAYQCVKRNLYQGNQNVGGKIYQNKVGDEV